MTNIFLGIVNIFWITLMLFEVAEKAAPFTFWSLIVMLALNFVSFGVKLAEAAKK